MHNSKAQPNFPKETNSFSSTIIFFCLFYTRFLSSLVLHVLSNRVCKSILYYLYKIHLVLDLPEKLINVLIFCYVFSLHEIFIKLNKPQEDSHKWKMFKIFTRYEAQGLSPCLNKHKQSKTITIYYHRERQMCTIKKNVQDQIP